MSGLGDLATLGFQLALQTEARRRAERDLAREERSRRRALRARFEQAAAEERQDLAQRLAAARARAGAAGVATGSSFDAVLRGLEKRTAERLADARERYAADLSAVEELFGRRRRRDLLQRTERFLPYASDLLGRFGRRSLLD